MPRTETDTTDTTMNQMTPSGIVHAPGRVTPGPWGGTPRVQPKCGRTRARYLIPTDQPVTCKKCLGH